MLIWRERCGDVMHRAEARGRSPRLRGAFRGEGLVFTFPLYAWV